MNMYETRLRTLGGGAGLSTSSYDGRYVNVSGDTMGGYLMFPVGGFLMEDTSGQLWIVTIDSSGALVTTKYVVVLNYLLYEDGSGFLLEDGTKLVLEN